jgi:hypothetical protein
MIHRTLAAGLAADRQQHLRAEADVYRSAAAFRRHAAGPSRTTVQISLLRRRLKQPTPSHTGAARPSYDDTARRAS